MGVKGFSQLFSNKPSEKAIEELKLSIFPSFVFDRDDNGKLEFDEAGNPDIDDRAKPYFDAVEKQ